MGKVSTRQPPAQLAKPLHIAVIDAVPASKPSYAAARREVHGDATPDDAWKVGGLFYFNPRDPAIWVENRMGPGYGLNMGNPRAWLLIAGMMLVPMIAARLLF